tara:strand:- start:1048 stop:1323 length:276 start_codon:yes stop_codon:yes gene_type:complete
LLDDLTEDLEEFAEATSKVSRSLTKIGRNIVGLATAIFSLFMFAPDCSGDNNNVLDNECDMFWESIEDVDLDKLTELQWGFYERQYSELDC